MSLLSIVVPVYNEERTICNVIEKISKKDFGLDNEIIVINDGSKDNTGNILEKIKCKKLRIINYPHNMGKGYAVREGMKIASGDIIAIQDADMEYNLNDLKKLVKILIKEKLSVVYGSRFLKKNKHYKVNSFYIANKILSLVTSALYLRKITDMETCYKVFRKKVLDGMELRCNRFDFEPEFTSKILKKKIKIREIPIEYRPRTAKQGKKIKWKDGLTALKILLKEKITQ
jgi:glycosyltransferase involved in cell wall biosynthesis